MDTDRPPDIVVVAAGAAVRPELVASVSPDARIIAADAGVRTAMALGWTIDLAVGDFDSLEPELVERLDDLARDVHRYPEDKDATDLELALVAASATPGARVLVAGIEGGRPDHALANLLLVASMRFASLDVELVLEGGRAWVVHGRLTGQLPAGTLLSVIPVLGPATVSIDGVRWPLDHDRLDPGSTHGISNEAAGGTFELTVHAGTVLCISPRTDSEVVP